MKFSFREYIGIVIHQTDLTLTNYVKAKLAPFNLAPEQNLIMMLLWEQDGLNQNEIAEQLNKDKTNIARMLYNLEEKGFIQRMASEHDRRSLRVYLTETGKELRASIMPIAEEFNDLVCKGISEEDLLVFKRVLSKICDNVE
ncbi:MarR family winged helix-turn-helix transcriptional regulator [Ammoniphilus sp. YIM 78166]|uniref:MarR family winged helix-turn-helix transcriptional regulator n=1 Tax=Ammoniphilus sp. YIM 78166 TaxID=1644106 RepID=UPI00106F1A6A|nr:MarR family transcriptional regulator [Ammoniphilus sp. YIM 78166]